MTKKNHIQPCYPLAKHNASRQIGLFDVLKCNCCSSLYYNDPNCVYCHWRILVFMQKSIAFFSRGKRRKKQGKSGESWEWLMKRHEGNFHMFDEWWKKKRVNPSFSNDFQYFLANNIPRIILNLVLKLVILWKHICLLIDIF